MEDNIMLQERVRQQGRAPWVRQLLAWSAVVGYCGFIYYLSDQPALRLPQPIAFSDKLIHVVMYAVLGWLWTVALRETWSDCTSRAALLSALILSLGYGLSDEWHQSFVPGRLASATDVVADMIGGGLGAGGYLLWPRRRADV